LRRGSIFGVVIPLKIPYSTKGLAKNYDYFFWKFLLARSSL
jgi:hypothetical protein